MKQIRTQIALLLAVWLLFSVSFALSEESGIDLLDIQTREGFSFSDSNKSEWTYYAIALANGTKGETVEIMLVSWGKNGALTYHPEMRFFVSDAKNVELKPQKATIIIGSNMFEINLTELSLENVIGSYVALVWEDDVIIKSLATGEDCKVVLQCGDTSVQAVFSGSDLEDLKSYSIDMLRYDFTKTIDTGNDTDNLTALLDLSSITAHIFDEVDKDQILANNPKPVIKEQTPVVNQGVKEDANGWKNININEIGLSLSLPTEFDVFTRNMSDDDPVAVSIGLSGADISDILTSQDLYLDALDSADNELTVAVTKSNFQGYSGMKDATIQQMGRNYAASWGITAESVDVYRNNDLAFMRIKGSLKDSDGNLQCFLIYYTAVNATEYGFTMRSSTGSISADTEVIMGKIMESVVITAADTSQISSYKDDPSEFTYVLLDDGSASITGYTGTSRDIMIPRAVDGHTVKSISEMEKNNSVENILIPETVEIIIGNPFKNLYGVKSYKVAEGSKYYSSHGGALYSYDKTILISYPSPDRAEVTPVIIPDTVKVIGDEAFYDDFFLTEIILPEGLEKIGDNAFYYVTELKSITIPSTVKEMGINPFYGANSLEEIIVAPGNSTYVILNGALYNKNEKSIVAYPKKLSTEGFDFPADLQKIGDYAFYQVMGLVDLSFPETLTWIGDSAFYGCEDSSFQELPHNIRHVGKWAFNQAGFNHLTIPGTTQLDEACFISVRVKDGKVIVQEGISELPPLAFDDADITSVLLPESLTSIGRLAFAHCTDMTSLNIPKAVASIGENAFLNCPKLTAIVEKGSYAESYCRQNSIRTGDATDSPKGTDQTNNTSTGPVIIGNGTDDPILSRFPGISWGMTKDDILEKYGKDRIIDMSFNGRTGLAAIENIYKDTVMILFIFSDEKLSMMSAEYSDSKTPLYTEALTKAYGTPTRTTLINAFYNNMQESQDGDIYAWKTESGVIALYLQEKASIEYWSLDH